MAFSYYFLRPNADSKADWTETPIGTAFSTVDDAVFEPNAPDTGDFIQTASTANLSIMGLETFTKPPGEIVRRVAVWAYGTNSAGGGHSVVLQTSTPTTIATASNTGTSPAWVTSGDIKVGNMTQATIDGLQLTIGTTGNISSTLYACYVVIITNLHTDLPLMGVG